MTEPFTVKVRHNKSCYDFIEAAKTAIKEIPNYTLSDLHRTLESQSTSRGTAMYPSIREKMTRSKCTSLIQAEAHGVLDTIKSAAENAGVYNKVSEQLEIAEECISGMREKSHGYRGVGVMA